MPEGPHYIDLRTLIDRQRQERYRSLLILADSARERSKRARSLAGRIDASYLNLLEYFESRPNLSGRIDRFGVDDLEALLLGLERPQDIVVVDSIDFLFNTWRPDQRGAFVEILLAKRFDSLERGVGLFVFFVLDDVYLRQYPLTNTRGETRILRLSEVSF